MPAACPTFRLYANRAYRNSTENEAPTNSLPGYRPRPHAQTGRAAESRKRITGHSTPYRCGTQPLRPLPEASVPHLRGTESTTSHFRTSVPYHCGTKPPKPHPEASVPYHTRFPERESLEFQHSRKRIKLVVRYGTPKIRIQRLRTTIMRVQPPKPCLACSRPCQRRGRATHGRHVRPHLALGWDA